MPSASHRQDDEDTSHGGHRSDAIAATERHRRTRPCPSRRLAGASRGWDWASTTGRDEELTITHRPSLSQGSPSAAAVGLIDLLIRNQQVGGSSPPVGSIFSRGYEVPPTPTILG